MYIESFKAHNLRSIADLEWDLTGRSLEGWHVVLGDNGAGKTSFLRGICLALLGPHNADPFVPDWGSYVRNGQEDASCEIIVTRDTAFDEAPARFDNTRELETWLGEDSQASTEAYNAAARRMPARFFGGMSIKRQANGFAETAKLGEQDRVDSLGDLLYLTGRFGGWFSAAYGPFRRFTGGDREEEARFLVRPLIGRHMSVFAERVALTQPIEWLIGLYTGQLDTGKESELLVAVRQFINQEDFLPNGVRFDRVTSKDVLFIDAGGATVKIEDLSDGYRSILCMTLELIRQLSLAYHDTEIFATENGITVDVPGVVLIDEVDVHLHPSWQRTIGLWYRRHFPKIQFIVTTHSPLVCQAAEHGTVYALGGPGEDSHFVEGADLDRLLYGDILDAYSTELFGSDVDRSPQAQALIERLAQLNILELERELDKSEKKEQKDLRRKLPTSAYTVSS